MARLERSTWNAIKGVGSDYRDKTIEAAKKALEEFGLNEVGGRMAAQAIEGLGLEFGTALSDSVGPGHTEAAQIGSASVQELVDGKFLAWHDRVKAVSFTPNTERAMAVRRAWLRNYSGPGWIDQVKDVVMAAVKEAAAEGQAIGTVMQSIREAWSGWSRGHAETIARTEVGTIYNTARVEEMESQEFDKHEWVASIDESTRDSHASADGQVRRIGDPFDVGGTPMAYPQEVGAPAGEVINCRCETIPVVED
jgi:SPP1 gp7 family putative phage head morphogenesis protein